MKRIFAFAIAFTLFTVAASAQKNDAGFRDRQERRGVETGQLTRGEKFKLRQGDRKFDRTKRHFQRDGKMSRREQHKLHNMKRHHRHESFRYRHNRRHRS